ncbi:MAG: phosphate acyltransferase PlsX, partial [Erysipelotrichaceae bacterium]
MKIAVDVMGGDLGPQVAIAAAKRFVADYEVELVLYGSEEALKDVNHPSITCVTTTQVMEMHDGALAIRRKKDASMVKAVESVENKTSDAIVSCGSTGALLSCATLILKTIEGIERPALLGVMPSVNRKGLVFLDLGANAENSASHLLDFAKMGVTYAS